MGGDGRGERRGNVSGEEGNENMDGWEETGEVEKGPGEVGNERERERSGREGLKETGRGRGEVAEGMGRGWERMGRVRGSGGKFERCCVCNHAVLEG